MVILRDSMEKLHKCYILQAFQKPNFVPDIFASLLTDAEYKVFDIIIRKTFGNYHALRAWLKGEISKVEVSYQEIRKATDKSKKGLGPALKGLVDYAVVIQTRNSNHPKGATYLPNIPITQDSVSLYKKERITRVHCSCRLMNIEGLKERKRQKRATVAPHAAKGRRVRANNIMSEAAKLVARKALAQKTQQSEQVNSTPTETSNLSKPSQRGIQATPEHVNWTPLETSYSSPMESSYSSPTESGPYISIKTQKDLNTHQSENTLTHPHYTPIDPQTGKQIPVSAWMREKYPNERQTIFNYLEYKLKKDERVRENPPEQDYYTFLDDVIDRRKFLSLWELQQFTLRILADKSIKKPTAAMRLPEKFSTEYYIALYQRSRQNGQERPKIETQTDVDKLWNDVLRKLEKRVNRPSFNTWIRPTVLSNITAQTAKIGVPDEVFAYWLGEYYVDVIRDTLSEDLGFQPEIDFWVDPKLGDETVVQEAQTVANQASAPTH